MSRDLDLLDVASFLVNPANANPPTLVVLAAGAVLITAAAVVCVLFRMPRRRRPTVDELADLDRDEALLRVALDDPPEDDTDGLTVPPYGWWTR